MASNEGASLPDSRSPDLGLSHPTRDEQIIIWSDTSASWIDSLTLPLYLKESLFLTGVPLAKNEGMTAWILVDKKFAPDQRQIFCSCESFRKRSLISDADGNVSDHIVHGIASVFCSPKLRGHAYPVRMMQELAKTLYTWQTDNLKCVGSILYSDIGQDYYAKLGWHPNISNSHFEFKPILIPKPIMVKDILVSGVEALCARDEALIRKAMAIPSKGTDRRMTIIPDLDHMAWHFAKEHFTCEYLFEKSPQTKGAIVGSPGKQIWAVWTHRYYGRPDAEVTNNVLYILRLVMERDETASRLPLDAEKKLVGKDFDEQVGYMKAVLRAAQAEAAEWKLDVIKLWDPTPLVQDMVTKSGIECKMVQREADSIASGLWYTSSSQADGPAPLWLNNEHYAWL
ncbi:MAG: hypothetical protein Q9160_000681 [Pyrenula sp. 1 TL-2023]